MRTLEDVRARLVEHPIKVADDMSASEARELALKVFAGCEREVIDKYLTGPKDACGIAVKRGDPIVITDPDHKKFGETTTVTRIARDGDVVRIFGKGKFETTLDALVRDIQPDPVRDLVSAIALAMRLDDMSHDPTA